MVLATKKENGVRREIGPEASQGGGGERGNRVGGKGEERREGFGQAERLY